MTAASQQTRGKQAKPTRAEVRAAWDRLRAAAAAGNVAANAALIALAENRPLHMESQAA